MNRTRTLALAATALLAAVAAPAQQRPRQAPAPRNPPTAAVPAPAPDSTRPGAPGRGMAGRGMGTGGLAAWLASDPAGLGLTPDQLTRVRAARDEAEQANAPLRARLQAAYAGRDRRAMTPADRRALMDSTRDVREQLRANLERSRTAAIGVLTPAQQQSLDRIRPNWRTGGPMRGMRGGLRGRMMMMRVGLRLGWRAGLRAERLARRRAVMREWRLERGWPWI